MMKLYIVLTLLVLTLPVYSGPISILIDTESSHSDARIVSVDLLIERDFEIINQSRVTDIDYAVIRVVTINETLVEELRANITTKGIGTIEPDIVNIGTELNDDFEFVKTYNVNIEPLPWKTEVNITIGLYHPPSGMFNDTVELTYIVQKYGAVVEFEDLDRYTNREEHLVSFFYNDVGDIGIESVVMLHNDVATPLSKDSRNFTLFLLEGPNTVVLNVTNLLGEYALANQTIYRDTTPPIISNALVFRDASDNYWVSARISDNRANDTGIDQVLLYYSGVTRGIQDVFGKEYELDRPLTYLEPGKQDFQIIAIDLAGNEATIIFEVTIDETETTNEGRGTTNWVLALLPILMISYYRRSRY